MCDTIGKKTKQKTLICTRVSSSGPLLGDGAQIWVTGTFSIGPGQKKMTVLT